MNTTKRTLKSLTLLIASVLSITLTSCNEDLDIQQSYPFTVETMPVPKSLAYGETADIRCELKCEGNYANTLYTIRYFQYDGEGILEMEGGTALKPNDRYLLQERKFRLYYTSHSDESQNFIVVIEDNFGNSCNMEFDFNADSGDDEDKSLSSDDTDGMDVVPVIKPVLTQ